MNQTTLIKKINQFVETDPRNALPAHGNVRIYDKPLVGFAAATDSLFDEFKDPKIIGEQFCMPQDWLTGAATVISYFLPFAKEIRDSNRKAGLPSEEWCSARIDGEVFNNALRGYIVSLLHEDGAEAVAPCIDPRFRVVTRVANWSERHAAYVAGLGTFGLHKALITEKGTAGRLGSVITTQVFNASKRPYTLFYEYCPFLTSGKCGACMKRCPPEAITSEGKNHALCSDYLDNEVMPRFAPRYGCAKCNISVPCEFSIPAIAAKKKRKPQGRLKNNTF